jgi:hypothetical protein
MCANNGAIQLLHVILTELVQLWSEWYYVQVFWMLPHPKSCTLIVWCVWPLLQLVSFIISNCNWVLACEFLHSLKLTSSILSFYVHSSAIQNFGFCQDLREEWKKWCICQGYCWKPLLSKYCKYNLFIGFSLVHVVVKNILVFICHRTLSPESVKLSRLTCSQWT